MLNAKSVTKKMQILGIPERKIVGKKESGHIFRGFIGQFLDGV